MNEQLTSLDDIRADLRFHERRAATCRERLGLPDPASVNADLLAACKAMDMTHIPSGIADGHVMVPISVLNQARAAIAKAEGGAV